MSGVTIAAPAPWMARAAISAPVLGRERGGGGGGGEDAEADDEHAPAAEAVAERGAGEQQHGVGQRVGVDGPFEVLHAAAEVVRGCDGRAVVTTRLSRTTMKSAIETIAKVHSGREPARRV